MSVPGLYFYGGDWFKDTRVLSLEARGAWIDMLVMMNEANPRGVISWTLDQYARFFSDSKETAWRVLGELQSSKVANIIPDINSAENLDVTNCHLKITVMSRRIVREEKNKENNRIRQSRHRQKPESNAGVTAPCSASSSSSSISSSNLDINNNLDSNKELDKDKTNSCSNGRLSDEKPAPQNGSDEVLNGRFKRFWLAYPRKIGRATAEKSWRRIHVDDALLEVILAAIEKQKISRDWLKNNGEFIPHPTTWLNQRRWSDEPEAAAKAKTREDILREAAERRAQKNEH